MALRSEGMYLLLNGLLAYAQPPSPLVGAWVLSEGWLNTEMVFLPSTQPPPDAWITVSFQPDGQIGWAPVPGRVPQDPGCSNAFGSFEGTWRVEGGHTIVALEEVTRGGDRYPAQLQVHQVTAEQLILRPVD